MEVGEGRAAVHAHEPQHLHGRRRNGGGGHGRRRRVRRRVAPRRVAAHERAVQRRFGAPRPVSPTVRRRVLRVLRVAQRGRDATAKMRLERHQLHGCGVLQVAQRCALPGVWLQAEQYDGRPLRLAMHGLRVDRELVNLMRVQLPGLQERVHLFAFQPGCEAAAADHLEAEHADAPDVEGAACAEAGRVEHLWRNVCGGTKRSLAVLAVGGCEAPVDEDGGAGGVKHDV